jgi:cell division protein FtsL
MKSNVWALRQQRPTSTGRAALPRRLQMNSRAICGALFAAVLLIALPSRAENQNARLLYAELYQMQRVQAELSDTYTNLVVVLRMEPASTNVATSNLVVYIDAKSGKIPVKIDSDGDFSVPMSNELLAENPWIITNQPRGTMKLDWFVGLVVRRLGTAVSYRPLMQVVRDCADVRERMRQVFPGAPKAKVSGLKLVFSRGTSATVTIHSQRGDRKLETDAKGEVLMPLDPDLFEENPLVIISKEPAVVELISTESGK